jgi:fimbrial chaperone protein
MPGKIQTLLVMILMPALTGQAFNLKPMSATLEPKGYGASGTFRLENESSNRVAFQASMVCRDMDAEGNETLVPATNLFTLFPPQGVIGPGQSQSLRLVWKGPSNPTNELSYRIIAEELPVNFVPEKGKAQIKILLRYQGTVYIRPKGARPDLKVPSLTRTPTNFYQLVVLNAGSAHQNLIKPSLTLTAAGGRTIQVSTNQLTSIEGENVLSHHTRNFLIALPPELQEQAYQAQIKVDE